MNRHGFRLHTLVEYSRRLERLRKKDLNTGDRVMVKTCNSIYTIYVLENGLYQVSGGWFDTTRCSPFVVTIQGCTWGGSALQPDIIAACGLCLEFGNRLRTSIIRQIIVIPSQRLN